MRKLLNLTQPQLSKIIGLSVTSICRIEKGDHEHISERGYEKIERFLENHKKL